VCGHGCAVGVCRRSPAQGHGNGRGTPATHEGGATGVGVAVLPGQSDVTVGEDDGHRRPFGRSRTPHAAAILVLTNPLGQPAKAPEKRFSTNPSADPRRSPDRYGQVWGPGPARAPCPPARPTPAPASRADLGCPATAPPRERSPPEPCRSGGRRTERGGVPSVPGHRSARPACSACACRSRDLPARPPHRRVPQQRPDPDLRDRLHPLRPGHPCHRRRLHLRHGPLRSRLRPVAGRTAARRGPRRAGLQRLRPGRCRLGRLHRPRRAAYTAGAARDDTARRPTCPHAPSARPAAARPRLASASAGYPGRRRAGHEGTRGAR